MQCTCVVTWATSLGCHGCRVSSLQCSWSHGAPSCSPPEHAYTSSVVLPMPEPDLSMPYNVITLTCTLLAMIIGSLLNVLRYRIEDRA